MNAIATPEYTEATDPSTEFGPLAAARAVADRLREDALARDRANAEPFAEAELLRTAGLPSLLLPTEVGGAGGSWASALGVVAAIAHADGSIAQLLAYHYVNAHNLVWVAGDEGRRRWGVPSAEQQWLWGDAVNPVDPDLRLERDGSGYLLRGRKSFATGASTGDVTVVGAVASDTGKNLLVVVPRDAAGFGKGGDWDNLGQRLSASGSVSFDDVRIEDDAILGSTSAEDVTPFGSLVTPAIQAAFGHFYFGVTRGALETAAEYTRTTSRPWLLSGIASATEDPYILATYGRLVARLRAAEALGRSAGEHLDAAHARGHDLSWAERGELAEEIAALKVVSSELAVEATSAIYEVTGARATSNSYGFDRFWRNVRTHTLHDPVQYKAREVGNHFLTGSYPQFTLYT